MLLSPVLQVHLCPAQPSDEDSEVIQSKLDLAGAYNDRFRSGVHESMCAGAIMVAKPYCPWKSHLYQLEKETGCEGRTLYVVYEDDRDGSWRLQVCSATSSSHLLFVFSCILSCGIRQDFCQ